MTKEEIRQAAQDWDGSGMATPAEEEAFIACAEWMRDKMIEKAIAWLKQNADAYTWYDELQGESGMLEEFIQDFKQAMEE